MNILVGGFGDFHIADRSGDIIEMRDEDALRHAGAAAGIDDRHGIGAFYINVWQCFRAGQQVAKRGCLRNGLDCAMHEKAWTEIKQRRGRVVGVCQFFVDDQQLRPGVIQAVGKIVLHQRDVEGVGLVWKI